MAILWLICLAIAQHLNSKDYWAGLHPWTVQFVILVIAAALDIGLIGKVRSHIHL